MAPTGRFRPGFGGCTTGDSGSAVACNPFGILPFRSVRTVADRT
jgi:hypothetical protein